jgi:hypothetical protein
MSLRISKSDKKIILFCSIIFLGAFLVLYFDLFSNLNEKSNRPIFAKAVVVENDVRTKSDQQLATAKSSTQYFIRYRDQIFTCEKSNVVLELEDNQRIKIQENSLVKFEQNKNVKNFKIMFGSMTTQVKKGDLIEVHINGEKIKIEAQSDDELKISSNDNCAKPEVKLNDVKQKVAFKPKKRQIATATKAIIETSLEPFDVAPAVPPPEPVLIINNPEKSYTFEARTSDQKLPQIDHLIRWNRLPQAAYYQLEISDNSDFTNVMQTEKLKKNSFEYPLKETGKLFYRVKAYSKNQKELTRSKNTSYVEYIKNFDLLAPSIVSDMKDQVFFFQKTQGQFIRLAWQNKQVEKAPNYYVEMSTSKNFESAYRKFKSDKPYMLLSESIPQGFYYWRVRSFGESIVSDWSETGTLKIQTKRAIAEDKKN